MIIKSRDSRSEDIATLEKILNLPSLTEQHRVNADKALTNLKKGIKGEDDSAYHINFHFGENSKNWAVIHDLRLEVNGRVAQIDHLLINRGLEFFVLESKNFNSSIEINNHGEFTAIYPDSSYGIESPILQNDRHIDVLKDLIKEHDIMPKRLGAQLKPTYYSYVLFSAKSKINRPAPRTFKTHTVIKADQIKKTITDNHIDRRIPNLTDVFFISRLSCPETVQTIAEKIASFHTPPRINYVKKLGIKKKESLPAKTPTTTAEPTVHTQEKQHSCLKCGKKLNEKTIDYCKRHKEKFNNQEYCYNCQNTL